MRYAISSHHAITLNFNCYTYILLRSAFERVSDRMPPFRIAEKRFNNLALYLAKTTANPKLIGPHLFDAVEFHLTDPRLFYNRFEWKVSDKMVQSLREPIASFHAHIEKSPLMGKYTFNLCDSTAGTKKAIRGQLKAAYRIVYAHPRSVVTENPVLVFHAGIVKDEADREPALARLRKNIEFIAETNRQLYEDYGRERKIIPTIENSPDEKGWLCQTLGECAQAIQGCSDEVKITLDYGHALTVKKERGVLWDQLKDKGIGENIVSLHLHDSPEVDKEAMHVHAPLSKIPKSKLQRFHDDLGKILRHTGIKKQGYVTLEVPSGDPLDYMPWLKRSKKFAALMNRFLKNSRLFEFSAYQGTMQDQLASLAMLRSMLETDFPDVEYPAGAELAPSRVWTQPPPKGPGRTP